MKPCEGTDILPDLGVDILFELVGMLLSHVIQVLAPEDAEGERAFATYWIVEGDDSALDDLFVLVDDLLEATGRDTMTSDVDHVVDASHDVHVALVIHDAGITTRVVARCFSKVLLDESLVVTPQAKHESRRHGKLDDDLAERTVFNLLVLIIENLEVVAWHRLSDRARKRRQERTIFSGVVKVGANGPRCLSLPPSVIDHSTWEGPSEPMDCVWVAALASHAEAIQRARVPSLGPVTLIIFFLQDANTSRGHEKHVNVVLLNLLPNDTSIRSDRLALEEDGRCT